MEITPLDIPEVLLIQPRVFKDERGYFFECFNHKIFEAKAGFVPNFVQDNESKSDRLVLRGLHYQLAPFAQAKLVRVIKGKILDVAVDVRKDSKTYGKYVKAILSEENKKQLFVPKGFAHGFIALEDETIVSYKCDEYYNKEHEKGITPSDPFINIDWGIDIEEAILSEKDKNAPLLKEVTTV
ncbi:MAG: dTDP-4-dehydrorhamnose 3,5-epimerase [Maribacter sp.]|jgi:dTDP-4-dehydrorhamnose 3,5-epimerase